METIYELTTEQVRAVISNGKVFDSVARIYATMGIQVTKQLVPAHYGARIHKLTFEQLQKIREAIGDGSNAPRLTNDPVANYVVDCIFEGDEEVPGYDEETQWIYEREIECFEDLDGPDELIS